jgi:adenosylcobinamide-GDP ribazoletransferase
MKHLFSAIRFITIVPVGRSDLFEPKNLIPFFPVVGLLIGVALALFDQLVLRVWPAPAAAVLDVVFLVVMTGAFHLDGLGDAADGLFSHRPREKALLIMKDSRVGIMGLVAVVCVLALKWAGLAHLGEQRMLALIVVPALARAGMIFGIRFLPYGRPEGGTGHSFFDEPLELKAFIWLLVPVGLSLLMGWRGILLILVFGGLTAATLLFYRRQMACVTGDMLGAMTEVSEAVLFLALAAGGIS